MTKSKKKNQVWEEPIFFKFKQLYFSVLLSEAKG